MPDETDASYEIMGQTVAMPVLVRDALSATAAFPVAAKAAEALLPDALEVVRPFPGKALLIMSAVHYRDTDLGQYYELSIALAVRQRQRARRGPRLPAVLRGTPGIYVHRLPVDGEFTCVAGRRIWGFPKTVEELTVQRSPTGVIVCRWDQAGEPVLRLAVRANGDRKVSERGQVAYAAADGVLLRTPFAVGGSGIGVRAGGARLKLGTCPVADELRELGIGRRGMASVVTQHMRAQFGPPEPMIESA